VTLGAGHLFTVHIGYEPSQLSGLDVGYFVNFPLQSQLADRPDLVNGNFGIFLCTFNLKSCPPLWVQFGRQWTYDHCFKVLIHFILADDDHGAYFFYSYFQPAILPDRLPSH
jgi:hypothetical protein